MIFNNISSSVYFSSVESRHPNPNQRLLKCRVRQGKGTKHPIKDTQAGKDSWKPNNKLGNGDAWISLSMVYSCGEKSYFTELGFGLTMQRTNISIAEIAWETQKILSKFYLQFYGYNLIYMYKACDRPLSSGAN